MEVSIEVDVNCLEKVLHIASGFLGAIPGARPFKMQKHLLALQLTFLATGTLLDETFKRKGGRGSYCLIEQLGRETL